MMKRIDFLKVYFFLVLTAVSSEPLFAQTQIVVGEDNVQYNLLPKKWLTPNIANFMILNGDGETAGYWANVDGSHVGTLAESLPANWSIKPTQFENVYGAMTTTSSTTSAWEIGDNQRPYAYWIPNNSAANQIFLSNNQMLTARKVNSETLFEKLKEEVYGWSKESLEAIRESIRQFMVTEAKEIACKQAPRPSQFTTTASFGASVTFVAGVQGNLDFAATWDTKELCGS